MWKNVVFLTYAHGLTIVAFGNGAPDIFSAIAAFTNSNPTTAGVAIGALLGMYPCCRLLYIIRWQSFWWSDFITIYKKSSFVLSGVKEIYSYCFKFKKKSYLPWLFNLSITLIKTEFNWFVQLNRYTQNKIAKVQLFPNIVWNMLFPLMYPNTNFGYALKFHQQKRVLSSRCGFACYDSGSRFSSNYSTVWCCAASVFEGYDFLFSNRFLVVLPFICQENIFATFHW